MLKPSMREKRHYLAIEIISKGKLPSEDVHNALFSAVKGFLGQTMTARAGMQILELNSVAKEQFFIVRGILSINRKYVTAVRASLALLSEINGNKASCRVKGVSGTIKKLREKFL